MEKQPFIQAAMAGLGKYRTGSYGWIGVYRVNVLVIIFYLNGAYEGTVCLYVLFL